MDKKADQATLEVATQMARGLRVRAIPEKVTDGVVTLPVVTYNLKGTAKISNSGKDVEWRLTVPYVELNQKDFREIGQVGRALKTLLGESSEGRMRPEQMMLESWPFRGAAEALPTQTQPQAGLGTRVTMTPDAPAGAPTGVARWWAGHKSIENESEKVIRNFLGIIGGTEKSNAHVDKSGGKARVQEVELVGGDSLSNVTVTQKGDVFALSFDVNVAHSYNDPNAAVQGVQKIMAFSNAIRRYK